MGEWSGRRLAAFGAVAAAIILVIGFLLPGSPPKFNADAADIIGFYHDHRNKLLLSLLLVEVGVTILVAVFAQLAVLLRDAGQRAHAAVVGIGGAASLGVLASGYALYAGLEQLQFDGAERPALPPLYRLIQFMQVAWYWMMLVVALAVALAAWRRAFPQWVAIANAIVAVLFLLGGVSIRATGAFAAGTGALATIGGIAFIVWVLHLAALFWRRPRAALEPGYTAE